MRRHQGVYRRPDSAVWWFALRTPKDLLPNFDGQRWAVRCSLGTADLREANNRARGLQAEWGGRFTFTRLGGARESVVTTRLQDWAPAPHTVLPDRQAGASPEGHRRTLSGHTPLDAFEAWERAKPGRPGKSVTIYRAAATRLAELLPGKTLEAMTKDDGRTVVAALLQSAQAKGDPGRNSAANALSRISTLLAHAVDLEWIGRNPFSGRTIERVPAQVTDWKLPELVRLFDHPLFKSYALPREGRAGMDAAYWLPVMGLYTGARISELAQLATNDLEDTTDAGPVMVIRADRAQGQRVKNLQSIRRVPIHPELIRLGLWNYRQAMAEHGPGRLFPAAVRSELNGAGGKASQWFSQFKSAQGFGRAKVFHSFRHTLQTRLLAAGAPEPHVDAITGHAGHSVGRRTYTHLTPADVRPSLERLQFPGLVLPRVFKVPAWRPDSST